MSITITINNNREHTVAAGTMTYTEYGCQSCEHYGPTPTCRECGGCGKVRFENLPFEMNLANGNFRTLWNSLGLEWDYCGSIDGRRLLDVLRTYDPALVLRATTVSGGEGRAQVIDIGIHSQQADSYVTRLTAIAVEAAKREEHVVWG